jgi:antitoxin YefM
MSIESLRSVRDHLSEFVDGVENQHERIVLTRNGHAAAILVSPEDLAPARRNHRRLDRSRRPG